MSGEIVEGAGQPSFLDARMRGQEEVEQAAPQPAAEGPSYSTERLPPVQEEEIFGASVPRSLEGRT